MTRCPACARHVRATDQACPFCNQAVAVSPVLAFGRLALGGLVVVGTLGGCPVYGGPQPTFTGSPGVITPFEIVAANGSTVKVGEHLRLAVSGARGAVIWAIARGDEAFASVDSSGELTGLKPGMATVVATTSTGATSFNVTVVP